MRSQRQMIGFLNAGLGKLLPKRGAGGGERLRGVKRLGADLANVVNTHETGRGFLLLRGEICGLVGHGGAGFGGVGCDEQGSQSGIKGIKKEVRRIAHGPKHTAPLSRGGRQENTPCCIFATKNEARPVFLEQSFVKAGLLC